MLMAIQGTLVGSIVTLVLLACFSKSLNGGNYAQLDAVWRLQMGLALIPALLTLWPRLKMPEGKKYLESRELTKPKRPDSVESRFTATTHRTRHRDSLELIVSDGRGLQEEIDAARAEVEAQGHRASLDVFLVYFREWRHLKTLIGTMSCWFLLDVAFYGINLNQSVLLMEIGYAKGANEYSVLKKNAIGNLIIAVAGYIPGYFFTIYFIEKLGRKWIQLQGFLVVALMFAIIAGDYEYMGTGGKFVCLAIAQVPTPSPLTYPFLTCSPTVLLQLRPQHHHLHHPRRSLPHPRARLRSRRQCRSRQGRRHTLGPPLQLSQRTDCNRFIERAVDFFRVQYSRGGDYLFFDSRDQVEGC